MKRILENLSCFPEKYTEDDLFSVIEKIDVRRFNKNIKNKIYTFLFLLTNLDSRRLQITNRTK